MGRPPYAGAGATAAYGSSVHKQVYIYGSLDQGPTELARTFGMAWGVGGWLLTPFLRKIGPEGRERFPNESPRATTTFASSYTDRAIRWRAPAPGDNRVRPAGHRSKYLIIPSP